MRSLSNLSRIFIFFVIVTSFLFVAKSYAKEDSATLSQGEILAALGEYTKIAVKMDRRPKEDREALYRFIKDLDKIFKNNKEIPMKEKCPCFDIEKLKNQKDFFNTFLPFEKQFQSILKNNVILQQPMERNSDIPNFLNVRMFAYWYLALAAVENEKDQSEKAMNKLTSMTEFRKGLGDTPQLLYVMIGLAIEEMTNKTALYLLPTFSIEDIKRFNNVIIALPDPRKKIIQAMKVEVVATVHSIQPGLIRPLIKNETKKSPKKLKEKLQKYLPWVISEITNLEKWLENGGQGAIPSTWSESVSRKIWPDVSKLLRTTHKQYKHRLAVIAAMDAEMKRRGSSEVKDLELPYDEERVIGLMKNYGCIEYIE